MVFYQAKDKNTYLMLQAMKIKRLKSSTYI